MFAGMQKIRRTSFQINLASSRGNRFMARYVHNINWMDVRIGVYCRRSTTPRSSPSKSKSSKDEIVVLLDLVAFLFCS